MTLLHQAAQKAVEALDLDEAASRLLMLMLYGDRGNEPKMAREIPAVLRGFALQHQEEPRTAVIPPAPPECETEDEKTAFAFGYWQGLHAARKGMEVPREPVAWYEQMRLTLIGQVHELLDIAERHAWTRDPEEKRRTEGAIAHARKVTAPYNYNGAASPSTTRQQEVGSGSAGGAMFKAEHEFLEWNRAQPAPLVKVAYEYGVFRKAVDLYLAAAPSTPEKAGGVTPTFPRNVPMDPQAMRERAAGVPGTEGGA